MRQTSSVRTVEAPAAHIPVAWEGDVIVCGGGSAGLMAALASAELGARTLLVERHGFLGGATTASLMFWFTTFTNGDRLVIRGMPYAFVKNSLAVTDDPLTRRWVQCDTERFKVAAVRELRKRGGGLLLHSWASEVLRAEDRVTGAILQNKSGRVAVLAKTVIDATGDGDLFPSAGVRFGVGTEDGGLLQPMSFLFQMDGVDPQAFAAFERTERHSSGAHLQNIWKQARESGELTVPLIGFKHLNHIRAGLFNVHATRVLNHSSIDAQSLSDAEVEGREQAWQVAEFLKRRVPGFENAFLVTSCTQIGVREGRRLTGAYVLTDEDVLNARKFDDVIACGCYNIDIHQPQGDRTVHIPVPEGDWYDIPYRCLYSAEVGGFLAAGRDISGTREAHGSYRGQSHCMAIGQAAGCAAALAARESCDVRTLDVELLQKTLRSQDAFLGE